MTAVDRPTNETLIERCRLLAHIDAMCTSCDGACIDRSIVFIAAADALDALAADIERLHKIVNAYRTAGSTGPFNKRRSLGRHANLVHAENERLTAQLTAIRALCEDGPLLLSHDFPDVGALIPRSAVLAVLDNEDTHKEPSP